MTKQQTVTQLRKRFRVSKADAELVWRHPHAGHIISYALARNIRVKEALSSGQLFKVTDPRADADGANYAYAWGVTAYEAWLQAQHHISTQPSFGLCEFEVVDG